VHFGWKEGFLLVGFSSWVDGMIGLGRTMGVF